MMAKGFWPCLARCSRFWLLAIDSIDRSPAAKRLFPSMSFLRAFSGFKFSVVIWYASHNFQLLDDRQFRSQCKIDKIALTY
jgi:hypothetical protein